MFDFPIEQIIEAIKGQGFGGILNSILLVLILLNIRSLKFAILKIEEGHDKRITTLETGLKRLTGKEV